MSDASVFMLSIALDGSGRPEGWVRDSGGTEVTFAGWLSLMSELASLVTTTAATPKGATP